MSEDGMSSRETGNLREASVSRHAVVMRTYGLPDVLRVEPLPLPDLGPSEILIRTLAAAVNRSDLEIRSGNWPIRRDPPLPYVPGLEVLGEVATVGNDVVAVNVGDRVFTAMQGLGGVRALRDGGYADYVVVDADSVAPVPDDIDPFEAAALGLGAVTADQGLALLGELSGRRITVTGAAGGVGSNAVAIAAAAGAAVVAVIHSRGADYVRSLGAAEVVSDPAQLKPRTLDGALDLVGGAVFEPLVAALRHGGRYCLLGDVAGDRVSFSLWELMRGIVLSGYSSETLNGPALRAAAARVFRLLGDGRLKPPDYETLPLEEAAEAHARMEAGGVTGRLLLVPKEH
jgi:NADPH:quinone reductase and related Zn-dependent oxidoreductases